MNLPVMLFTPIPPMETGLATYAVRVLEGTSHLVDWTVAYPEGGDPGSLPDGIRSVPISSLGEAGEIPRIRIFNIGNSFDCFPVLSALYRYGGTGILHETVLHHVLREGYEKAGMPAEYLRELQFCYGPSAEDIKSLFDRPGRTELEYDALLKTYPLIGRTLHNSTSVAVLNEFSLRRVSSAFAADRSMVIGHPLSPLPELAAGSKPYGYTVLMAGGCHPGRNLEVVIKAVSKLREKVPDAGLLLLGSGYPAELPEWVTARGKLDEKDYQEWIRVADAAVDFRYPTCGETSGSLLEILRAGVPCICSDSGAYAYIPSEAVLRIPASAGSDGLAASLSYLHKVPETGRSISASGTSYANDVGSRERMLSDWGRLIEMADSSSRTDLQRSSDTSRMTLSAAWHPVPEGFERDLATQAVSWRFSGKALIEGSEGSSGAILTAWGRGTVNGKTLPAAPECIEISGSTLSFEGEGWVASVEWCSESRE